MTRDQRIDWLETALGEQIVILDVAWHHDPRRGLVDRLRALGLLTTQ
jgi:hypothetical protein